MWDFVKVAGTSRRWRWNWRASRLETYRRLGQSVHRPRDVSCHCVSARHGPERVPLVNFMGKDTR
jgi:hypothetical protein